jgi:rare lipoprotein A
MNYRNFRGSEPRLRIFRRETPAVRERSARRLPGRVVTLAVLALAFPFAAARASVDTSAAVEEGIVSWYGESFHERPTASGELFDATAMTMAHPTLPFGTTVKVTNLRNGRSVVVRVNDRGPFVGSRIADVSQAAAASLGMLRRGLARARIEILGAR